MINSGWGGSSSNNQGQNTGRRAGWSGPSGMVNPSTWKTAAPSAPPPAQARNTGNMTPFNPYMSQRDYFSGIAPWRGGQLSQQNPMMTMGGQQGQWQGNQLQAQNPMMSMGNQQNPWKSQMFGMPGQVGQGQLQAQNPMMSMGGQQNQGIPSYRATSNPYMPSYQQNQPQQQPQNPYSPYRNDWGWAQQSPFAGLRYPAY